MDRRTVYLEEDCDAPAFIAWCETIGVAVAAEQVIHDGPEPIREMRPFRDR